MSKILEWLSKTAPSSIVYGVWSLPFCVLLAGGIGSLAFEREDLTLDLDARTRYAADLQTELNLIYADDHFEHVVHSACVDTCMALDYDTENRDGPQFVYTCIGHGANGFTCEWTNLDDNRKPKKTRMVRR